jgi:hypothetical protein
MGLITDIKLFFQGTGTKLEKFEAAFVRLFGKAPTALQAVENFLTEAAPVIEGVDEIAAPATEPLLAAALDAVEAGLATLSSAATGIVSAGGITQALTNLNTDVPALLTAVDVKDSARKSTIEGIVTTITGELKVLIPVVEKWVASLSPSPSPAAS